MNPAIRNLEKRNIPPLPCWRFFRFVFFAFFILSCIILGYFVVTDAHADYIEPNSGSWDNQPITQYSTPPSVSSEFLDGYTAAYRVKSENNVDFKKLGASTSSVYVACYAVSSGTNLDLVAVSIEPFSLYSASVNVATSGSSWGGLLNASSNYDSSYNVYYKNQAVYVDSAGSFILNIPVYSDRESALSSLAEIAANGVPVDPGPPDPGPTPPAGHNATFTLPAGNVAFVDFGSSGQEYKVEMRTTFPFNSDLFSGQFSPVSQKWGWADSLPTSSGALSSAGQYVVPWYKTEPYNLLKQSKSAYVTSQTMVANGFWNETTSSRYLVINNPYFNTVSADSSGNPVLNNGNIIVSVENAVSVRVLSATDSLTSTGIQADVNPDVYYDGTFTDSGGTDFTNQDGAIASPEYGGNNFVPPAASAESLAEQIKNILNDLVSKITTIFTATHDAILTLVSAAREFFGVFGLLYAWLPAEVYAVLQSGMIVAVTIGIFKVFL